MADVIVVGAGIIGCAIARELAARGVIATVVDPRPPGGGATQASAGMLAPYIEAHDRGPLLDLGVRSLALYDDWIASLTADSGIDVEYRRTGTLEVALDPDHADELRRSTLAGTEPPRAFMDPDAARRAYPSLGGPIAGAVFIPSHGYVAALQLTQALVRAAERRGTQFLQAAIQRIRPAGTTLTIETTAGELTSPTIVLAAGAWTNEIDAPAASIPPLRPVRGQLLHLGWHADPIDTIVWGPECYIVPRADGTLLVGATVEDVGFDERATAAGIRDLLDAACELLPAGWGATFLGARVGLRPATPDDLPVMGPDARLPGLVHASGHFRNGVLLAPITAKLIADLIVQKKHDPALDTLRPGRFERVRQA
jgi:glycine oxidase